jgi:hypothetical protein
MAFTFEELISFASRGAAVAPGDLLASGTCQRGCLTEIWGRAGERVPPPLVPGDGVTLEVEGLGTVRNRVVDPAPSSPIPPARKGQPAARATKGSDRHAVPWALARASVMAFAPPCEVCPPSTGISAPLR